MPAACVCRRRCSRVRLAKHSRARGRQAQGDIALCCCHLFLQVDGAVSSHTIGAVTQLTRFERFSMVPSRYPPGPWQALTPGVEAGSPFPGSPSASRSPSHAQAHAARSRASTQGDLLIVLVFCEPQSSVFHLGRPRSEMPCRGLGACVCVVERFLLNGKENSRGEPTLSKSNLTGCSL